MLAANRRGDAKVLSMGGGLVLWLKGVLILENSAASCSEGPALPSGGWMEAGRWQTGLEGALQLPFMLSSSRQGPC